jgi:dimethylhistidine N-methyltransferase
MPAGEKAEKVDDRLQLVDSGVEPRRDAFARDVRAGLTATPKSLSCVYLYDQEGSRLFERITDLPEYYLTRAEREILTERAEEIASRLPDEVTLVELGSGSSTKTRLLIEAFLDRGGPLHYMPVDISRSMLVDSSRMLLEEYPDLEITAIAGEYALGLRRIKEEDAAMLILWLGSNVGNFQPDEAAGFLRNVRRAMTIDDRLLMGVDLRKDKQTLERAYDDAQGVTAQFSLNLIARINRQLGGRFDLNRFRHRAVWKEDLGRVEIHIVSTRRQTVRIDRLDMFVEFAEGETIHTENSYKYTLQEIDTLAAGAGLAVKDTWLDSAGRFSVNLLAPVDGA